MPNRSTPFPKATVATVKKKLADLVSSLKQFLVPYLPHFGRAEVRETAEQYVGGLLSGIPRKTAEPVAEIFGRDRKSFQRFVGTAPWKDEPIREAMKRDIAQTLGHPDGVIMGAFAEFERSLLRERQREGIALAKQRGVYRGRKRALAPAQAEILRQRARDGEEKAHLAREFGISRETV